MAVMQWSAKSSPVPVPLIVQACSLIFTTSDGLATVMPMAEVVSAAPILAKSGASSCPPGQC